MAKQYVGARYVPITYENPDDGSASWKANVEYESLTIVVASNGDSYTSKKAVPRNVGAPQDNPEYWVKTGDFNASLLALQGRVNTIEGDLNTPTTGIKDRLSVAEENISDLEEKVGEIYGRPRYLLIGDSYSLGHNTGGTVLSRGWFEQVISHLGLIDGEDVFKYGGGGYGFIGRSGTELFINLLNTAISELSNDEKISITDIVVIGGVNDLRASDFPYSTVVSNIQTFITTARNSFPHAKITIGYCAPFCSWIDDVNSYRVSQCRNAWRDGAAGARFVDRMYDVLMSDYSYMDTDGLHPTTDGYTALGKVISEVILGSEPAHDFPVVQATVESLGENVSTNNLVVRYRRTLSNLILQVEGTFDVSSGHTADSITWLPLFKANIPASPQGSETICQTDVVVKVLLRASAGTYAIPAFMSIDAETGYVKIRLLGYKAGTNNRYTWSEVGDFNLLNINVPFEIGYKVL